MAGTRRWLIVIVAVIAAALALVACGDDDDSASTSPGAETSAQSFTGPPVKVGVIVPDEVTTVSDPFSRPAVEAGADAMNARGGLAGHEVQVVYCNDKGDPNETSKCARQFNEEGVLYVTGGQVLNDSIFVKSLGSEIPLVGFNAYTTYAAPNAYLYTGGSFFNYQVMSAWSVHQGLKTGLVSADVQTAGVLRDILKGVVKAAGSEYSSETLVPPTQADMAPIVAAAQEGGTQAAVMFVAPTQNVQFIKAATASGADLKYILGYTYSDDDIEQIGPDAVAASTYGSPFPPFDSDIPMLEQFRTELAAYQAETGDSNAALANQTNYSFSAWLSLQAVEKVLEQQNVTTDLTPATLTTALDAAQDIDLGVIPPWTPSAPGPKGLERVSNATVYVIQYNADGSTKILTPTPVSIDQAIAGDFG